jgi:hypothetical protein
VGRLIAVLVAAAILAPGAGASAQVPGPVSFTSLERDRGGSSGYDARTSFVIRTQRRWRHVWRRLHGRTLPRPKRPRVDFRRSTVIAVLRGSGTGIGLQVTSVARGAAGLHVQVSETRAGERCAVLQQIVSPYELIRIARTPEPVITERSEVVGAPCL